MADNAQRTPGSGESIAADEVTDGVLGLTKVQFVKIMDGTLEGTAKAAVSSNGLAVELMASPIIGTTADAAPGSDSAPGSVIAKLTRLLAQFTVFLGRFPAALVNGSLVVTVRDAAGNALDPAVAALIEGGTAHDAAMSTRKPVAVGGRASTALPTAVADGDLSHIMVDRMGRLIARTVLEESLGDKTTAVTAGPTAIVTADAANKNRLYGLILANTNTTNAVKCELFDDATSRAIFQIPAGETRGFMLPPDGGLGQATINKAWNLTITGTSSTVTATALFAKTGV